MHVLITGGAGNLARYCLAELQAHGHIVTLFDRYQPEEAPSPWQPDVPVVVGDLTRPEDCQRAVEVARAEAILHLGGIAFASEDPRSREAARRAGQPVPPEDATFRVNILGTFHLLEAARRAGVRVIAFASTASVLLETPDLGERIRYLPIDEEHPAWPGNTYALSKRFNEEMLEMYSRVHGLRAVAFRMVHVFMPHLPPTNAWNLQPGQPASPPPPGHFAVWEYLDARDAATAYRLAIERDDLAPFELMYLATDRSVAEEHRELIHRFYPHLRPLAESLGPDDLIISIRRARERLGYVPRHSWRGAVAAERVR